VRVGWRELDAAANEALAAHFDRTGWSPVDARMPFADLMEREQGTDESEAPGEYEVMQRMQGVRIFFGFLAGKGAHPADMLRQLAAVGRALRLEPWCSLTMTEQAQMDGQTKAAHSWRCKVLSGEIELRGGKGSRLPGQKSAAAVETYRVIRKGNTNRRDGLAKKAASSPADQPAGAPQISKPNNP